MSILHLPGRIGFQVGVFKVTSSKRFSSNGPSNLAGILQELKEVHLRLRIWDDALKTTNADPSFG
jgi:hypothetical protein